MLISFEKANKIVAPRDPQSGANAHACVQAGEDSRTRSRVLPAVLCATSARNNCWRALLQGLTLETSAFESLYGGQFTLSTQLIERNYLVILPPTQHHSFFRNLPPLLFTIARKSQNLSDVRSDTKHSRLCFLYPGIPGCL